MLSYKVIKLVYIILPNLQKVKALVSIEIVVVRPNQPLELVNIVGLNTQNIIGQWVNLLLFNEVPKFVVAEMNLLSMLIRIPKLVLAPPEVGDILAVVFDPFGFHHVDLVVEVVREPAEDEEASEDEVVLGDRNPLPVQLQPMVERRLVREASVHKILDTEAGLLI